MMENDTHCEQCKQKVDADPLAAPAAGGGVLAGGDPRRRPNALGLTDTEHNDDLTRTSTLARRFPATKLLLSGCSLTFHVDPWLGARVRAVVWSLDLVVHSLAEDEAADRCQKVAQVTEVSKGQDVKFKM